MTQGAGRRGEKESGALIVADVGGSHISVAVALADGQITWREEIRREFDPDPEANLQHLFLALDPAVERAGMPATLAIGVPGPVDFKKGIVTESYALGWVSLPLRSILEERYGITAIVDNDVNLASLGEAKFGAGMGAENLVCMLIGTNVGGGIVIDGKLYRGPNGAAGEIGWMVPDALMLGGRYSGIGPLESYSGGRAIALQAQELLRQQSGGSAILEAAGGDVDAVRAEHVFEAVVTGDETARKVLERAIDYLSVAVANVVNLLDPEVVIIGGGVSRSGEFLIDAIHSRIEGVTTQNPPLVLSVLGEDAVLYGGVALAQEYMQIRGA